MTEWAELLVLLDRYRRDDWMLGTAVRLYDTAMARSADLQWGGMHYSYAPDGRLLDLDKYHWVHAETLAATAMLAERTGERRYWQDYDRLWAYCWRVFVDHRYGAWFDPFAGRAAAQRPEEPAGQDRLSPLWRVRRNPSNDR